MEKRILISLFVVIALSFCACSHNQQENEKITVSNAVAARIEKNGEDRILEVTSEIDSLDTFDDLNLVRPQTEIPLLGEWVYRITFNPSEIVKNSSEIVIQFGENCLAINDQIYVTSDGIDYADVLEWVESKYSYFYENNE